MVIPYCEVQEMTVSFLEETMHKAMAASAPKGGKLSTEDLLFLVRKVWNRHSICAWVWEHLAVSSAQTYSSTGLWLSWLFSAAEQLNKVSELLAWDYMCGSVMDCSSNLFDSSITRPRTSEVWCDSLSKELAASHYVPPQLLLWMLCDLGLHTSCLQDPRKYNRVKELLRLHKEIAAAKNLKVSTWCQLAACSGRSCLKWTALCQLRHRLSAGL